MNRNHFILLFVALAAAFSAGRFMGPKQVEVKEVEKIVYKERVSSDETKNTNFEIIETTLPDGTKTRHRIRQRSTQTRLDSSKEADIERSKDIKTTLQSDWSVGVYRSREAFAATIDRRILGGIFLGVFGRSELPVSTPEVGIGLRLEF